MSENKKIRKKIILTGRVQGVGFRYFTYSAARENNLNGYVKNLPDGSIEILVDGNETAYCRFLQRVLSGPSLARVIENKIIDSPPGESFNKFEIRY